MKTTAMTTIDRWRARGLRPNLSRQTLQTESWVDPEAAFDRAMDRAFDPGPTHEIGRLKAALKRGYVPTAMGEAEAKLPTYGA
jgi:hypothetical protein